MLTEKNAYDTIKLYHTKGVLKVLKDRKKFSVALVVLLLSLGVVSSTSNDEVYADNPNIKSTFAHLTGGWDANFLGSNGKHWTNYTQKNMGNRTVYASIHISGKVQEVGNGTPTRAYVKSAHNVGPYVTHYHNGNTHK